MQHVIARGNRRAPIVHDDHDYAAYAANRDGRAETGLRQLLSQQLNAHA
ncbi:MAG: hypothetical protein AAB308_17680 [Nitrospirota bacterium]